MFFDEFLPLLSHNYANIVRDSQGYFDGESRDYVRRFHWTVETANNPGGANIPMSLCDLSTCSVSSTNRCPGYEGALGLGQFSGLGLLIMLSIGTFVCSSRALLEL